MPTVLVTGATGNLGGRVVKKLLGRGASVRAYAREEKAILPPGVAIFQGDIRAGSGLAEATAGVDAIVHAASFFDEDGQTDLEGTRHLVRAASRSGSPHLVYVSIVGIDRSHFRYFKTKLEVEKLLAASRLPYSIQRATQFHDFVFNLIRSFEDPHRILLPDGLRFQSIDTDEVADTLVDLVAQGPAGKAPDLAGPGVWSLEAMAREYLDAFGKTLPIEAARLADGAEFHDAFRDGSNLVAGRAAGRLGWSEYLRRRAART